MPLPKINPTKTNAWKKLEAHFSEVKQLHMATLFAEDISRVSRMKLEWEDFYLDYSKNRVTHETIELLLQLTEEVQLKDAIRAQFNGVPINETEDRAVLHTALRDFDTMKPEVKTALQQMQDFSEKIISGTYKGYTGKPITDIVNIGIGGSHLGPEMITEALSFYKNQLTIQHISNIDGDHVQEVLKKISPETTLFIVVSKSFTTQETLTNATTVRNWFVSKASEEAVSKHFVAVSSNIEAVKDFGVISENIFPMWNWVGGRFSLWSAVGLSICCSIGYTHFEDLLKGAHKMDTHFRKAAFSENMPVILALLSVWYNNFFKSETEAVIPYAQYLSKFVDYLQQAVMESNGKSVDRSGDLIKYETSTILWGSTGTNAQHAFFQLLHQGTKLVPCDFIAFKKSLYGATDHQTKVLANCFAQTEALLEGANGKKIDHYKDFNGNRPSNTLLIDQLTPQSLGKLIALYEHKIFVQGIIWNIFSYDQWGVELGKSTAKETLAAIENKDLSAIKNESTKRLLQKKNTFK